jgi:hypothetical protein
MLPSPEDDEWCQAQDDECYKREMTNATKLQDDEATQAERTMSSSQNDPPIARCPESSTHPRHPRAEQERSSVAQTLGSMP